MLLDLDILLCMLVFRTHQSIIWMETVMEIKTSQISKQITKPPLEFSTNIFLGTMWNRTWDLNNT